MNEDRPKPVTIKTTTVPQNLRDKFKAWCARRGYTMENTVIAMVRNALDADRPISAARKANRRPSRTVATLHTRNVPPGLKKRFKEWCANRGYTMQDCVVALMARAVEEDKPIAGANRKARVGG